MAVGERARAGPAGLSTTRLRTFAAVVEEGSYSAAARRLGVTQPTVSFHVRSLERIFGDGLLEADGHRSRPTAIGSVLYGLAQRVLRDVEETRDAVAGLRAGKAGRVRLGASIAFEQRFFFDVVVRPFVARNPAVELTLTFGTSRDVADAVRTREVALGYVMALDMPPGVHFTPLHGSRVVLFVAREHPLAAASEPTVEEISDAGLITAPLNSYEWSYYRHMLQGVGLTGYRVAVEVSGIQARILAAQAGLGVLAVFWPPYAPSVALPGLVAVRLNDDGAPGPAFGLATRAEESLEQPVDAFVAWLKQQAAG